MMSKTNRSKNALRIQDRLVDELIGICRGVIADSVIDEREAIFIGQWIENHREVADRWPVNIVYARVTEMLRDGILSGEEKIELLATLRDLTGEGSPLQEPNRSTTLPLTRPHHPDQSMTFSYASESSLYSSLSFTPWLKAPTSPIQTPPLNHSLCSPWHLNPPPFILLDLRLPPHTSQLQTPPPQPRSPPLLLNLGLMCLSILIDLRLFHPLLFILGLISLKLLLLDI